MARRRRQPKLGLDYQWQFYLLSVDGTPIRHPGPQVKQMREWLRQNVKSGYRSDVSSFGQLYVYLDDDAQAVLFKLRFADDIRDQKHKSRRQYYEEWSRRVYGRELSPEVLDAISK